MQAKFSRGQPSALLFLTVATLAPSAGATVVYSQSCGLQNCGYSIDPSIQCGVLPANHVVSLGVTCGARGLGAVPPELVLSDGTVVESHWERPERPYGPGGELYLRTGAELPVGEVVRIMHRVPASCYVASVQSTCGDTQLACLPFEPNDCCALFETAGLRFSADNTLQDGNVIPLDEASTPPAGPLAPLAYEYGRFRVVEPDREPPPSVGLRVDCRNLGSEASGRYAIDYRIEADDLTDAVKLELLEADSQTGTLRTLGHWSAQPCAGQPARQFLSAVSALALGTRQLFIRSHDAAGNVRDGPATEFGYPEDCRGLALAVPNNDFPSLCGATPYVPESDAAWCAPPNPYAIENPDTTTGEGGAPAEASDEVLLESIAHCDTSGVDCVAPAVALPPGTMGSALTSSRSTEAAPPPADPNPRANSCYCHAPGKPMPLAGFGALALLALVGARRAHPSRGPSC